jgi:UDP:flavonoid glycosyltransferase YjiC (YdhE family)
MAGMAKWFSRIPLPLNRVLRRVLKRMVTPWLEPVETLRKELGLPHRGSPLFEGQHSPQMVLAMFSKVLAEPQPDWPPNTRVTGFCFYDKREAALDEPALPRELQEFLMNGPPPILFTLGSSAIWDADRFYQESIEVATRLGQRAVLLIGHEGNRPAEKLPDGVVAFEYAPYGEIMARVRCIVQQGGVGTTGEALRAGRPVLFVPFSHDQPDNAWRVKQLGMARMVARRQYKAARVARELDVLLNDSSYARRAEEVGRTVRSEDGPRSASELIEQMLSKMAALDARREELIHASGD